MQGVDPLAVWPRASGGVLLCAEDAQRADGMCLPTFTKKVMQAVLSVSARLTCEVTRLAEEMTRTKLLAEM
jgi:hypothetical protein